MAEVDRFPKWMNQWTGHGLALVLSVLLAGCAGALNWPTRSDSGAPPTAPVTRAPSPPSALPPEPTHWQTYTVRAGETLNLIGARYGVTGEDLARWNRLSNPNLIQVGQRIKVPATAASSSPAFRTGEPIASGIDWQWPVRGSVLTLFQGEGGSKGIDIGGSTGMAIAAAADGRVAYAGSGLKGYGELIIIKHNNNFLSAYAYNRTLHAQEGDTVQAGQTIAEMGEGPNRQPSLHFEIRYNGQPVDPLQYLPAR